MKILLVEPFLGGSHAQWALGLKEYSQHNIEIIGLPDQFWKWRMYASAVTLAEQIGDAIHSFDLVLATDMLDLPAFIGLTRFTGKTALYFHESQWLYPWSPIDRDKKSGRDYSYGFLNFRSAISADVIFFNSQYHQTSFLESAPTFLKRMPDYSLIEWVDNIRSKSRVLYPGLELASFDKIIPKRSNRTPIILWNHRWEFDKNPDLFLLGLEFLESQNLDFQLILLGENQDKKHMVYETITEKFAEKILHHGYVENQNQYHDLICRSDILPVTSVQDFFGISALEAMYAGVYPLLPDRLAFPEHIPNQIPDRTQFYYSFNKDFPGMLSAIIQSDRWINYDANPIRKWISRYDWRYLINEYDHAFQEII